MHHTAWKAQWENDTKRLKARQNPSSAGGTADNFWKHPQHAGFNEAPLPVAAPAQVKTRYPHQHGPFKNPNLNGLEYGRDSARPDKLTKWIPSDLFEDLTDDQFALQSSQTTNQTSATRRRHIIQSQEASFGADIFEDWFREGPPPTQLDNRFAKNPAFQTGVLPNGRIRQGPSIARFQENEKMFAPFSFGEPSEPIPKNNQRKHSTVNSGTREAFFEVPYPGHDMHNGHNNDMTSFPSFPMPNDQGRNVPLDGTRPLNRDPLTTAPFKDSSPSQIVIESPMSTAPLAVRPSKREPILESATSQPKKKRRVGASKPPGKVARGRKVKGKEGAKPRCIKNMHERQRRLNLNGKFLELVNVLQLQDSRTHRTSVGPKWSKKDILRQAVVTIKKLRWQLQMSQVAKNRHPFVQGRTGAGGRDRSYGSLA